jgi:Fe-S oxidoreductase
MADNRQNSLCCGGGGGRIWAETPKQERFADLRVAQARETGARVLATSCPYCVTNFEESRLSLDEDDPLQVKDVTELVLEALQAGNPGEETP